MRFSCLCACLAFSSALACTSATEPADGGLGVDDAEIVTDATSTDIDDEVNGEGPPCETAADCPTGWRCLYWRQAPTTGVCEPSCPGLDAFGGPICACDGTRRAYGCTDYPWSHQAFDLGVGPDGGVGPGAGCQPGPVCNGDS